MKFSKFYFVFLFLAAIISGCASSGASDNQVEPGDYTFTMYGTDGIKLLSGVMTVKDITVTNVNSPSISGTYTITNSGVEDFPGKSAMDGQFAGSVDYTQGKVFINTNPKIADANVFFNATIYSTFYEGRWTYSTFRGPTAGGKLTMRKK